MVFVEKKVCVFVHFSVLNYIPHYVVVYANELSNYFDDVLIYTNKRELKRSSNDLHSNVKIVFEENEGYDLGFFYKYFKTLDHQFPSQIACVNDSNLLIHSLATVFEWGNKLPNDFWGIVDSTEKPWFSTHENNYHIQSHFLVFNQRAIQLLKQYFDQLQIETIFSLDDPKLLRRKVINDWEIGLSQFLIGKGLTADSFIRCQEFTTAKGKRCKNKNIVHRFGKELLDNHYPLIKKKLLFEKKKLFKPETRWDELILKYGNPDWNLHLIVEEMNDMMSQR